MRDDLILTMGHRRRRGADDNAGAVRTSRRLTVQRLEPRRVLAGSLSLSSEPIEVFQDRDGVVYLLEPADRTGAGVSDSVGYLHRWSTETNSRLPSITLSGSATEATLSDDQSDLYLGYANGKVTRVDLTDGLFAEQDVFVSPGEIDELFVVGDRVLAVVEQYAERLLDVRDSSGSRIAFFDLGQSDSFSYDADQRRLYSLDHSGRVQSLQLGLLAETGQWSDVSGSYPNGGELVISPDGSRIVTGGGYLYTTEPLAFDTWLVGSFDKAAWISNEQVISLRSSSGGTQIRQSSAESLQQLRVATVAGSPLAVFPADHAATIVTYGQDQVHFHDFATAAYLDIDLDGVPLGEDAFPNDVAASVDTDHDGYPDVWNAGKERSDSTTNLYLDSHPFDSACRYPFINVVDCDSVRQAAKAPIGRSSAFGDEAEILYHVDSSGKTIYRYSVQGQRYLNPIVLNGDAGRPDEMVISTANQRIYLLYETSNSHGAITQIDYRQEYPTEVPFATIRSSVSGLSAIGEYVIVATTKGRVASNVVLDSAGTVVSTKPGQRLTNVVWNPSDNFFYHGSSGIRRQSFDLQTGEFGTEVSLISRFGSPVAVSPDGRYLLSTEFVIDLEDGGEIDLFDSVTSGVWLSDGTLVAANFNQLRQWDSQFQLVDFYSGDAHREVLRFGEQVFVVEAGRPVRHYELTDDKDGDGFTTFDDAFPFDPAASQDTDGDGYPDRWNEGKDASDSTSGLRLDAFPEIQVCFLPQHGRSEDPSSCDIASTIHGSVPTQIHRGPGDTVALLDPANERVHVWSTTLQDYAASCQFAVHVTALAISDDQSTAYVGANDGTIYSVDLSQLTSRPIQIANLDESVKSLALVGDFVVVLGDRSLFSLDRTGQLADQDSNYRTFETLTVDSMRSAVYSADAINRNRRAIAINQQDGSLSRIQSVGSQGLAPLALSADGQQMIDTAGVLYAWNGSVQQFQFNAFLSLRPDDALWIDDRHVTTLRTSIGGVTIVETWNDQLERIDVRHLSGNLVGIVRSGDVATIVTLHEGRTHFYRYDLSTDFDGDGVATVDDAFPIDATASVDTDRDGAPDALHENAENGSLVVDAFPKHSACQTRADAVINQPDVCDIEAAVGEFWAADSTVDGDGIIYLLDQDANRILRRETTTGEYLDPILLDAKFGDGGRYLGSSLAPRQLAYAAGKNWLLIAYSYEIDVIDLSESIRVQQRWYQSDEYVGDMVIYGDRLFLSASTVPLRTIHFDSVPPVPSLLLDGKSLVVFDPANATLYYTDNAYGSSSAQVRSVTFDQQTGDHSDSIVVDDASELHSYRFGKGVNSPDGSRTVFPGGGVVDLATFDLLGVLWSRDPSRWQARWIDNETIVTASGSDGTTHVDVWSVNGQRLDHQELDGDVRELAVVGDQVAVVTDVDSLTRFHFVTLFADRDGEVDRPPTDFEIVDTAFDSAGVVYLLDAAGGVVHRWDSIENEYLNPLMIDGATQIEIHPASQTLLVGDAGGRLLGYDLGTDLPIERVLQSYGRTEYGIASYGDSIRVSGTNGIHLIGGDGSVQRLSAFHSGVWNEVASTWTSLDGDSLVVAQVDPLTGQLIRVLRSPRNRNFRLPITVSSSGSHVLLGNGDVYSADDLSSPLTTINGHDDAVLFDDAMAVVLRSDESGSFIEWHDPKFGLVDRVSIDGVPKRLVAAGHEALLASEKDGRLQLERLTLNEDSDGDGRTYQEDAFPLDASISVDTDGDGYPDAWHDGYSQSTVTPGLELDAFPGNEHCHRESDRIFGQSHCVAEFVPDVVQSDGGDIVYLLDAGRRLVHRWSAIEHDYLPPLRMAESDRGRPTALGIDAAGQQLFVGYETGHVSRIDLASESFVETLVTTVLDRRDVGVPVTTLVAQPEFLYVVAGEHYTFDDDGNQIALGNLIGEHVLPAFDGGWVLNLLPHGAVGHDQPVVGSVYQIPVSPQGQIGYGAETKWQDPVVVGEWLRLSPNRQFLFSQRGDVWKVGETLSFRNALPAEAFSDADWLTDDVVATVRAAESGQTVAEYWDTNGELLYRQFYRGNPVSVRRTGGDTLVLVERDGAVVAHPFVMPRGSVVGSTVLSVGTDSAVTFEMKTAHASDVSMVYRVEVVVTGASGPSASGEPLQFTLVDLDGQPVESIVDPTENATENATVETERLTRLVILKPGYYRLTVRSARPLGKVRVKVAIDAAPGDSTSRLLVEKAEALVLSKSFAVSPVLRRSYEQRLGASLDVLAEDPTLDQNANGIVDAADLMALRTNLESAADVVWAELGEPIEHLETDQPLRARDPDEIRFGDLSLRMLTNSVLSRDVDNNGMVTPRDALLVINQLARSESGGIDFSNLPLGSATSTFALPKYLVDVNGDRRVSPLDVLLIINDLARSNVAGDRSDA
ncbi:dockerin type I domain-containing protein [Planctomycetes bacterium TBK1r]|uniref:dockerin type I domain-containing protein n=1 Tax=Stieleria magnilauensis TaxID=2527963 RepID=UPI0011A34CF6